MKILQICPKPPLPAIDGGCIASHRLSLDLSDAGHEVHVISLATAKHPYLPEKIDEEYKTKFQFSCVAINTHLSPVKALLNLFSSVSVQQNRFYSKSFRKLIDSTLSKNDFDLILFDGLTTCFYLNDVTRKSKAICAYRAHNIEWILMDQMAESQFSFFKKIFLRIQAKRLRNFELDIWSEVDSIFPISNSDTQYIKSLVNDPSKTTFLPFTVDFVRKENQGNKNKVFHLGAMDWKPNIDGVRWFLEHVWPLILKLKPHAELHLGGKNISDVSTNLHGENVVIHNYVEDARSFIANYTIMVVPVQAGSGTRIKVLQGMSEGVAIVSTFKGIEGMGLRNNEEVLVADDPNHFAGHIVNLLEEDASRIKLTDKAFDFLEQNHSKKAFEKIFNFWVNSVRTEKD